MLQHMIKAQQVDLILCRMDPGIGVWEIRFDDER